MSTLDYLFEKYGPTMTPNDVGEALRCHPTHVRSMFTSGELPGVKIGERWHIPTVKLAEIIEGGIQNG